MKELDLGVRTVRPEQRLADRLRDEQADGKPDETAEHARHGGVAQPRLGQDDDQRHGQTQAGIHEDRAVERMNEGCRVGDHDDEDAPDQEEAVHGGILPGTAGTAGTTGTTGTSGTSGTAYRRENRTSRRVCVLPSVASRVSRYS